MLPAPSTPPTLQPTLKDIIGAHREAEYFAALDELAENAFDDQVSWRQQGSRACAFWQPGLGWLAG